MENKEIIEGNKLVAEFDGWVIDNSFPDKDRTYIKNGGIELDTTFKYHTSWDWLMHVVEKIESLGYDFEFKKQGKFTNVRFKGIIDYNCKRYDNITAIYNAVVEFIKWYNENKNK